MRDAKASLMSVFGTRSYSTGTFLTMNQAQSFQTSGFDTTFCVTHSSLSLLLINWFREEPTCSNRMMLRYRTRILENKFQGQCLWSPCHFLLCHCTNDTGCARRTLGMLPTYVLLCVGVYTVSDSWVHIWERNVAERRSKPTYDFSSSSH